MPTLTTKLEAVNSMLGHIGESPVNSISSSAALPVSAVTALSVLDETSREVQSEGWHFNTEIEVTLERNADDDTITLAADTDIIDVDSYDGSDDIVLRGLSLFDRCENLLTFTADVKVNLTRLLAFESLPEHARRYITLKASRVFQGRAVGSRELEALIARDEYTARARLEESDGVNSDRTIFGHFDAYSRIGINRNYRLT
jgi:hypothetical protein